MPGVEVKQFSPNANGVAALATALYADAGSPGYQRGQMGFRTSQIRRQRAHRPTCRLVPGVEVKRPKVQAITALSIAELRNQHIEYEPPHAGCRL